MKSRLFLVTFLLILWGGVTFGQGRGGEKRITASFSGIPLSEAIGTIEKTSGYTFFYDVKKTDLTQKSRSRRGTRLSRKRSAAC